MDRKKTNQELAEEAHAVCVTLREIISEMNEQGNTDSRQLREAFNLIAEWVLYNSD